MKQKKKILIIAAHPDDEVIGCGATVARFTSEGHDVFTLILGEGITSRDDERDRTARESEITLLKKQIHKANKIIGVKDIFTFDLPDNRFDTVPLLDIVKKIEKIKNDIRPDIVLTHYWNDLNIDHCITYKAVLTATRPMVQESVKEVYCFEVLSSTEWEYPLRFSPNVFIDVHNFMGMKLKSMKEYISEIREYPHPRSLHAVELTSECWGMRIGVKNAEAFVCARKII